VKSANYNISLFTVFQASVIFFLLFQNIYLRPFFLKVVQFVFFPKGDGPISASYKKTEDSFPLCSLFQIIRPSLLQSVTSRNMLSLRQTVVNHHYLRLRLKHYTLSALRYCLLGTYIHITMESILSAHNMIMSNWYVPAFNCIVLN